MRRVVLIMTLLAVGCVALSTAAQAASGSGWGKPNSCHARGTGLYVLPDPRCTPGAINPVVTQANIHSTICSAGWSSRHRPPESVTEPQKRLSLAAYGYYDGRSLGRYEFDHLISLELGGASDSPKNLWPEPDYPGVSSSSYYLNPKDHVEDELHDWVCSGKISLAAAQRIVATNWIGWYRAHVGSTTTGSSNQTAKTCTVAGSWSSEYDDFDIYVHSNAPDETVTVSDSAGVSATYHTDSSGYADVYLHAPQSAGGGSVTATVGGAHCSGRL